LAVQDPDRLVADAATRALEAHMTPPSPPAPRSWKFKFLLAIIGLLTTWLVSSLLGEVVGVLNGGGWDWYFFILTWIYPINAAKYVLTSIYLIEAAKYVPWFLLCYIFPLIPFSLGLFLRLRRRNVALMLVVFAGCVAGFAYFAGFFLICAMLCD
jgi:hypothetical protein